MNTKLHRITWIDMLKGLAILLVVIGHVLDGYIDVGIWPNSNRLLKAIYDFIYAFHMPLCFMISGYLYFLSYFKSGSPNKRDVRNHCIDFGCVYAFFCILMWFFKTLLSGSVNKGVSIESILFIWARPMPTYWYLYVLIVLYLLFAYTPIKRMDGRLRIAALTMISFISHLIPSVSWFQITNIAFYAVFFCFGMDMCRKQGDRVKSKEKRNLFDYVLFLNGVALNLIIVIVGEQVNALPIISTIVGILIPLGLMSIFSKVETVRVADCLKTEFETEKTTIYSAVNSEHSQMHLRKGKQSFLVGGVLRILGTHMQEIYVMHIFIAPATRMLLLKFNVSNMPLSLTFTILISIIVPIMIGVVLRKLNLYDWLFRPYSKILRR